MNRGLLRLKGDFMCMKGDDEVNLEGDVNNFLGFLINSDDELLITGYTELLFFKVSVTTRSPKC